MEHHAVLSKGDDAGDPHIYTTPPPAIANHPIFRGGTTVGLMTADAPRFPAKDNGGNHSLQQHLNQMGLKHEPTRGSYGGPESSFIIYNPTREQMYHLGHHFGQEAVVYSQDNKHELLYTHGPNAGKYHPSLPTFRFSPEAPEDYYTHIPGHGHLTLHFNFDKLEQAPLVHTFPHSNLANPPSDATTVGSPEVGAALSTALKKALASVKPAPWAGAYPWHEAHTAHHKQALSNGVLLTFKQAHELLALAKDEAKEPAHATNAQSAGAGVSTYAKFAAPYGTVNKGQPSNLKFYPMEGHRQKAVTLVHDHGFKPYYAGGVHGKADLANKNFNTGHLMLWDPSAGTGSSFGHQEYTDAWRHTHELGHALTYPALNEKYGEGRRMGGLGKLRTSREAKRAVEWEWLAAHKQRELNQQIGVHVSDEDFNRELNTVMHDAVHRAVTGKFTEPSEEGFVPHAHKVPLETALGMVDEASHQMGLQHDHDLIKKSEAAISCPATATATNPNTRVRAGVDSVLSRNTPQSSVHSENHVSNETDLTHSEVRTILAEGLKSRLESLAGNMKALREREVRKSEGKKLAKSELCALCGNADRPGSCTCLVKSDKSTFTIASLAKNDGNKVESFLGTHCDGHSYDSEKDRKAGAKALHTHFHVTHKDGTVATPEHIAAHLAHASSRAMDNKDDRAATATHLNSKFNFAPKGMQKNELQGYGQSSMAMSEMEKCKDCGKSHSLKKCGQMLPTKPIKKEEKVPQAAAAEEKKVPGAVLPDDKAPKKMPAEGSGGELRKDATPALKDAVFARKPMPKAKMGAAPLPGMTPEKQAHPHTLEGLADVKGLGQARSLADGLAGMGSKSPIVNANQKRGSAATAHISAGLDRIQAAGKQPVAAAAPGPAAKPMGAVAGKPTDAAQGIRDKMNLEADKKAGGVGWLNSLISRFRKPAAAPAQAAGAPAATGPARTQSSPYRGVRGMAALARSESIETNLIKSLGDCALCSKAEHLGDCS